jgi:hypothetical protein
MREKTLLPWRAAGPHVRILSVLFAGDRRMGIDLEVLASHFRERRGEMLPTARLRFDRDGRLFAQLDRHASPCLVQTLPQGLKVGIYEDQGLAFTEKDRSGNALTFTTSADLRRLQLSGEDIAPWNQAILAFLLALPAETRIVLYWC